MDGLTSEAVPGREDCDRILAALPALPLEERGDLVERLVRNSSPELRERALRIGAAVLSDNRLGDMLRADGDAVLRNAGSEIFLRRGGRSLPAVMALLGDPDPDVVLQAVLILDRLRDPRSLEPLYRLLSHPDANVVQESILAIGRLGDGRSVPRLLPFLDGELWVRLAALQALGDLRAVEGAAVLIPLLRDEMAGELAAESLARIGGEASLAALAGHWLDGGADEETAVGLLAYVLEGLPAPPRDRPAGLVERLTKALESGGEALPPAAARCLLCLGPGPWDSRALAVLAAALPPAELAPEALRLRPDLLCRLLRGGPAERAWGFLLAARFPDQVPDDDLIAAIRWAERDGEGASAEVAAALGRLRSPAVARELLDLYLRLPGEARSALEPALEAQGAEVRAAVGARADLGDLVRLKLLALAGAPDAELSGMLLAFDLPARAEAVSALLPRETLLRDLPWRAWLAEAPELFTDLAAEAAGRLGLVELRGALRDRLCEAPSAAVVRALGKLRDAESAPALLQLLAGRSELRFVVVEALGLLGGDAARDALRRCAETGGPDARLAYKALAACHQKEDLPLFRGAASHPDWFVRLTAVEVLAASAARDDTALLARLAADPVPTVAERALSVLPVHPEERH